MQPSNLHPLFAEALAPFSPRPVPQDHLIAEARSYLDSAPTNFPSGTALIRRLADALATVRDPEPDDFEPVDGPDYDDPDDLLS